MKSVAAQIAETHFAERMFAILSFAFAAVATLLAAVGVFGVTAYTVTRRMREFGIRMALGARPENIVRMVLGEMGVLVAAGTLIGVPLAIACGRLVEAQLFGLKSSDMAVIGGAAGTIAAAALIAAFVPCRRAAQVNPVSSLRYE